MRAISTEMTAPRPVLLLRSRVLPVFLPRRAKARANGEGERKPELWTVQAPFSAFENTAMLLLVAAAAISVGIGLLATQEPAPSLAGQRDLGAPNLAIATYNPGQAH